MAVAGLVPLLDLGVPTAGDGAVTLDYPILTVAGTRNAPWNSPVPAAAGKPLISLQADFDDIVLMASPTLSSDQIVVALDRRGSVLGVSQGLTSMTTF